MSDLLLLQERLGYRFQHPHWLQQALTHPSAVETAGSPANNQRLEFLGDAVLQLVISGELFEKFPGVEEGPLTKARAKMVNGRTLSEQARRLQLGAHLVLNRGEECSGGRHRASILADSFEAVMGAMFLDGGFAAARECILNLFRQDFGELEAIPNLENPKGELQELIQAQAIEPPQYCLESTSGPDHDRVFESAVRVGGVELGRGRGKSKKEAESAAAQAALIRLRESGPPPPAA